MRISTHGDQSIEPSSILIITNIILCREREPTLHFLCWFFVAGSAIQYALVVIMLTGQGTKVNRARLGWEVNCNEYVCQVDATRYSKPWTYRKSTFLNRARSSGVSNSSLVAIISLLDFFSREDMTERREEILGGMFLSDFLHLL